MVKVGTKTTEKKVGATTVKLSALTPDNLNANKGTPRGTGMLEESLRKFGAGRSILADKNLRVIAGNKTIEGAASIGLEDAIVVQSDGTKLIVVQRTDLDLDDPKTRELAIADNRTGEVNLTWDPDALLALQQQGADLAAFFYPEELDDITAAEAREKERSEGGVEEIEWSEVADQFWISLQGPLAHQAEVLQLLKQATAGLQGVRVELGTIDNATIAL